jgi:hypothetical protein
MALDAAGCDGTECHMAKAQLLFGYKARQGELMMEMVL